MGITFRVASGRHDFEAVANLWNQRYGRSQNALSRFRVLIQMGSLIVTEEAESDRVLGAVPLDFLSVDNGLLVAFNLTDGDDYGSVLRQQIHLVLQAATFSAISRVIFYDDGTEHCRRLIWDEFNALSAEERLAMSLEIPGTVEDYLRDNRDAAPSSLFIRSAERPDLSRQAQPTANAVRRTARDLSLSNPPQFLNIAGQRIENKVDVKEQREHEKIDKDLNDQIKNQEKDDKDKNDNDKDVGEKNVADKPDKDIKDWEGDKDEYDKNSADKQASEKQKEKDETEKDPVSEKPEEEKGPTGEKDPTEKDKDQSEKDEDGTTGEPEDRQRFPGPELEPNIIGTRQIIIYRALGISLPASLIKPEQMVEV
jgi:hypothetical protein